MRCEQYQAEHGNVDESDKLFVAFAVQQKMRQCPKCRFWVERTSGCDAMQCRCNLVFCYQCGGVLKSDTGMKQCKCVGVAQLLQAHEGQPNHNNLPRGGLPPAAGGGEGGYEEIMLQQQQRLQLLQDRLAQHGAAAAAAATRAANRSALTNQANAALRSAQERARVALKDT